MNTPKSARVPNWFWAAASLGLVWNLFGIYQFLSTAGGTVESLMAVGLTQPQAELYVTLPFWLHAAFALGVFGGTLGSVLLLLRKSICVPVFAASLVAYIVLYIGDITQGVFAAFGTPQVLILTTVVAIAAALLGLATHLKKTHRLA
jgi:hypothetical protein